MITGLASIFINLFLLAQQGLFPTDDSGKYILMKVVEIPGHDQTQLYNRGSQWLEEKFPKTGIANDSNSQTLSAKGNMFVHNAGSLKKHPDGAVEYDITLEFKDGRYRYTLTNFAFIPYFRNRYGKFEADRKEKTPLETKTSQISNANWDRYIHTTHEKCTALIEDLQTALLVVGSDGGKKVKKAAEW